MAIKISASILGCDFANLGQDIKRAEQAGADYIHVDVMDGVFVNNISFGLPVLKSINNVCSLPLDVHLMITKPERYIKRFAESGADIVTFHYEATEDPEKCIALCREAGASASVSIKPETPVSAIYPYLPMLDSVLVMTVEPGFGGQKFIESSAHKLALLRDEIKRLGLSVEVQVDGGINLDTAPVAVANGAKNLVVGSYLFGFADMKKAVDELKGLA